ncbi:hypothetical protein HNO89_003316 [Sporosarcina luteola]|nr:hypothetical protein [Sporosarcina luteola]
MGWYRPDGRGQWMAFGASLLIILLVIVWELLY